MERLVLCRQAILDAWFAATLETYPDAAARSLASGGDRFRNPAGHLLRDNLGALFDAAIAAEDDGAAAQALGEIVRLRAVQDFDADGAIAFIEPLKAIVRAIAGMRVDDRVDRLAHTASKLHAEQIARIAAIAARETTRRNRIAGCVHPQPGVRSPKP